MSGSISATTMVAIAATVASTAISAVGAANQAQAQSNAANYNAAVAAENQQIANTSAQQAAAAGEAKAEQAALETRAKVGGIKAQQAASNIDVNSGSAVDVRSSADQLGELNALTVRSNAAKQAWGYQTQGASYGAQSTLDKYQADSASSAGALNVGSTVLGGIGGAATQYSNFLKVGGVGSGLSASGQVQSDIPDFTGSAYAGGY